MASAKRGGGPGTYVQNGVVCTQGSPFDKAMHSRTGAPGEYGANHAPFNKAQDMGSGGIPTKFFDSSMKATSAKSTSSAGASSTIGITKRNVGDRRFPNAK